MFGCLLLRFYRFEPYYPDYLWFIWKCFDVCGATETPQFYTVSRNTMLVEMANHTNEKRGLKTTNKPCFAAVA